MTTALSLITSAMRKAGALTKTETPSADEAADGLEMLNDLLGSWSAHTTLIKAKTVESFTLTGGTASYTIGSGQTFDTAVPIEITGAFTRFGGIDTPVAIVNYNNYYEGISLKTVQGEPEFLLWDGGFPSGTIKLYPTPAQAYELFLISDKPISQFSTLSTDIDLPFGLGRAIRYNLAVEVAPEYGQPVSQETAAIAVASLTNFMNSVARTRSMDSHPSGGGRSNIYTGWNN